MKYQKTHLRKTAKMWLEESEVCLTNSGDASIWHPCGIEMIRDFDGDLVMRLGDGGAIGLLCRPVAAAMLKAMNEECETLVVNKLIADATYAASLQARGRA